MRSEQDVEIKLGDKLLVIEIEKDYSVSDEELTNKLRSSCITVHRHLQQLGNVPKLEK